MKIKDLIESNNNQELLVSEVRELIVELASDLLKLMPLVNGNKSILLGIDSRIAFFETLVTRAVIKYKDTNSPDAEFIRNNGVQLLQHIKTLRQSL